MVKKFPEISSNACVAVMNKITPEEQKQIDLSKFVNDRLKQKFGETVNNPTDLLQYFQEKRGLKFGKQQSANMNINNGVHQ